MAGLPAIVRTQKIQWATRVETLPENDTSRYSTSAVAFAFSLNSLIPNIVWGEGEGCFQDAPKSNFNAKCLHTAVAHSSYSQIVGLEWITSRRVIMIESGRANHVSKNPVCSIKDCTVIKCSIMDNDEHQAPTTEDRLDLTTHWRDLTKQLQDLKGYNLIKSNKPTMALHELFSNFVSQDEKTRCITN